MNMKNWEILFRQKIKATLKDEDPSHDLSHFERVVAMAKLLSEKEGAKSEIVIPAAWLHDLVVIPKDNPLRSQASRLSAQQGIEYLKSIDYPAEYYDQIAEAIQGHSFSAGYPVKSIEAKVVQDADRLDALGAMGIARCFVTAGLMKRTLYAEEDPFCEQRSPDDSKYTIDHFYKKLFKIADSLQTYTGQQEGQRRLQTMRLFLQTLQSEIHSAH